MTRPKLDADSSPDEVLEQIGLSAWTVLHFRCLWNRWPPTLRSPIYQRLLGAELVTPPDAPNAFGVPTPVGHAVADLLDKNRDVLVAMYEGNDGPEIHAMLQGAPFQEPSEVKDPFENVVQSIDLDADNIDDPAAWEKTLCELATSPDALRHATTEMAKMMAFLKKVMAAIEKLPKHLNRHYRGELMAIGKDLVRDLDLGAVTEDELHQVLLVFLQRDDDDDDDEPEPKPVNSPQGGEKVLA